MTGESQTIEAEEVAGEDEPTLVFAPPKSVAWSMQVAQVWAEADEVFIAGHDDTGWVMTRCAVGPSGAPAEAPEPGQWVLLHGDGAALWSPMLDGFVGAGVPLVRGADAKLGAHRRRLWRANGRFMMAGRADSDSCRYSIEAGVNDRAMAPILTYVESSRCMVKASLSHGGGVERTFDYWLPKGWIHFIENFRSINPSRGLPVLIMLHGGSDSSAPSSTTPPDNMMPGDYDPTDPAFQMLNAWRFHRFADRRYDQAFPEDDTIDEVDIDDRFAVVVPRALKTNYGKGGWNTGYQDRIEFEVDDVGFIQECLTRLAARMTARLTALSRPLPTDGVLDPRRHYLFGYSNGGMMAYRLLTDKYFAERVGAVCVVAGSVGGKGHNLVPQLGGVKTNTPNLIPSWETIPSTISLLAIHGVEDEAVVPGLPGAGINDVLASVRSYEYFRSGGLDDIRGQMFRRVDLCLRKAEEVYATYSPNACAASYTVLSLPTVVTPGSSTAHIRRRTGAPTPAATAIPFKGVPGVSYPWFSTVNPEVWVFWDYKANHATITGAGANNRWPDVAFIWAFLRRHRKVNA